jgi:small subunit ribosomal protein S17
MADEEKTEETPAEGAVDVESAAPAETPAAEPTAEETDAQAEAEETTEPAAPAAAAAPAEPQVQLTPKERKVAIKARKSAKTGPRAATTPEERQAEREATRAKKAAERRTGRASERAKWKAGAHERTATPAREHETGQQKTRQGVVVSDKADKTITVRIDVARRHRKYQKIVRTSNTLHAHDETNDAHIGDTVVVREARPLSRTKRWRLVQVVERAK